jgi:D-inositol-3-phosphate glycosyltransferase
MSRMGGAGGARPRVAMLSLHTSPLDQPGTGDAGGMNVYIRAVAERLSDLGVAVDVYTRCAGRGVPEVEITGPLSRIIQVPAGPCAPVDKGDLRALVPRFTEALMRHSEGRPYALVHAHYWLSGRAGMEAAHRWGIPLVASFHTLGRVKNLALPEDLEPPDRLRGERDVMLAADRVLAPTPSEAANVRRLYGTPRGKIRLVPPGVDRSVFRPSPKEEAKATLGVEGRRVVLFVGRLQHLKAPDIAIRAVGEAVRGDPRGLEDVVLAIVGGPSGAPDAMARLGALASAEGIADRVSMLPPRPHEELPAVYSAADVVVVPSRSESFGLVALEAQACGTPVVASNVGGLRHVVDAGRSGFLVPGGDHRAFASRLRWILADPDLAAGMGRSGIRQAARFPWSATAAATLAVYEELVPGFVPTGASEEVPA